MAYFLFSRSLWWIQDQHTDEIDPQILSLPQGRWLVLFVGFPKKFTINGVAKRKMLATTQGEASDLSYSNVYMQSKN